MEKWQMKSWPYQLKIMEFGEIFQKCYSSGYDSRTHFMINVPIWNNCSFPNVLFQQTQVKKQDKNGLLFVLQLKTLSMLYF